MKRSVTSWVLLVVGCLALLPAVAVPLLHNVFEGPSYGVAAAVRTVIILVPMLGLGALYVHRATGRGETSLILATLGVLLIQPLFLAIGRSAPSPANPATYVRSDALNLVLLQEIFRSDEGRYSADVDSLGFSTSDGVDLELRSSGDGWSARLTHSLLGPEYACSVWQGATEPFHAGPGRIPPEAGRPLCYQRHRLSGLGAIGDALFGVHQRMDQLFGLSSV